MPTDAQTLIDLVATQGYEKLSRRELIECILAAAQGGSGSTPAYQDMQMAWTPTNLKLGELLGLTTGISNPTLCNVETLTFNQATSNQGFDIESLLLLTDLQFPNLVSTTDGGSLFIYACPLITSLIFPAFVSSTIAPEIAGCDGLISISFPKFTGVGSLTIKNNQSLTTFSAPLWIPTNNVNHDFTGNALDATSVNSILARCVANAAFTSGKVDTSGGTSVAPTGQGIIDKATLNGRLAGLAVTN